MATPLHLANPLHCNGAALNTPRTPELEIDRKDCAARAGAGDYLLRAAARLACTVTIACLTAVMGR